MPSIENRRNLLSINHKRVDMSPDNAKQFVTYIEEVWPGCTTPDALSSFAEFLYLHSSEPIRDLLMTHIKEGTLFLAPDGTPTTLNPIQWLFTQTAAFKAADYYMLNGHQEPHLFYHGALHHNFLTFKNEGSGIYFTPDKKVASTYGGNDAHPYEVFVQSRNTCIIDFEGDSDMESNSSHKSLEEEYHLAVEEGFDAVYATATFDGEYILDQLVVHDPVHIHLADTRSLLPMVGLQLLPEEEEQNLICRSQEEYNLLRNSLSAGTYLKALDGTPTLLTPRQWIDVRTQSFKSWFGDWEHDAPSASKCVSPNGEPKVYYHGTRQGGFTVFDSPHEPPFHTFAPFDTYWFTDDKEVAISYSGTRKSLTTEDINRVEEGLDQDVRTIYECFLNVRTPYEISFGGADWQGYLNGYYEAYILDEHGNYVETYVGKDGTTYFHDRAEVEKALQEEGYTHYELREDPFIGYSVNDLAEEVLHQSEDGLFIYNVIDRGSHSYADIESNDYIVFNPNQIKSATLNHGNYSVLSDDIRFHRSDEHTPRLPEEEVQLRDHLIWLMRQAGIKVCVDHAEGQSLLEHLHHNEGNRRKEIVRSHRVYHGSSADFQTFDFRHYGTGIGHHIFGWGGYFTENPSEATSYAHVPTPAKHFEQGRHQAILQEVLPSLKAHLEQIKKEIKTPEDQKYVEFKELTLKWLEHVYLKPEEQLGADNHFLYTVEIPDNNGTNYLDLSAVPESKMIDRTKKKLERWLVNTDSTYRNWHHRKQLRQELAVLDDCATHRALYEKVLFYIGDEQSVAEFFKKMGFVGLIYPMEDPSSEETGVNYVIFNDADIQIKDKVRCFRTPEGVTYGFTYKNDVYIDTEIATSETPIHEYAHLWASVMQKNNPTEWNHIVSLLRDTLLWNEIRSAYPELEDDDAIADEVLATFTGRRGAQQLRQTLDYAQYTASTDPTEIEKALSSFKQVLQIFWTFVGNFLKGHYESKEDVADQILSDLLNGVNPLAYGESPLNQSSFRAHAASPSELAHLQHADTIKVYRSAQKQDGQYYPCMSALTLEDGKWKWRDPIAIGAWEVSDEDLSRASAGGYYTLNKGNGSSIDARYNTYFHCSRTMINDQFSSAWSRPELCLLEVEIPVSELTSGYKAEQAKDSVGEIEWKSGPVSRQLAKLGAPRQVILTRYDHPVREVPVHEVAQHYAEILKDRGIAVPFNTVNSALRDALLQVGVKISAPEKNNAGRASLPAYTRWKLEQTLAAHVETLASLLHVGIDLSNEIPTQGQFDAVTGKILVNLSKHDSIEELQRTIFHEAAGHYGLRALFQENFDQFIENVYHHAEPAFRESIDALAQEKGFSWRVATEEALSQLAEDDIFGQPNNGSWLNRIRGYFHEMISLGLPDYPISISRFQLIDILHFSYHRLRQGINDYPNADTTLVGHEYPRYFHRDAQMVNINDVQWSGRLSAFALSEYYPVAHLCHQVKAADASAIKDASERLSMMLSRLQPGPNAVLVPIPNRSGHAEYTLEMAHQIGAALGIPVIDALQGTARESLYQGKRSLGKDNLVPLDYTLALPIPANKEVILIDNVLDTGNNAMGAFKALGRSCQLAVIGSTNLFERYNYPIDVNYVPVRKNLDIQEAHKAYVQAFGTIEPSYSQFIRSLISKQQKETLSRFQKDAAHLGITPIAPHLPTSDGQIHPALFDEPIHQLIDQYNVDALFKAAGAHYDQPMRLKNVQYVQTLMNSTNGIPAYAFQFIQQGEHPMLVVAPHMADLVQNKNCYPVHLLDERSRQLIHLHVALALRLPLNQLLYHDNYRTHTPFLSSLVERNGSTYRIKSYESSKNSTIMNEKEQKKVESWKTHDYSQYTIPEGVDIKNLNVFASDTAKGRRYYVSCILDGKRRSECLSYPDVCAFFEKDEQGVLTKRVTAEQLFAKYVFNADSHKEGEVMNAEEAEQEAAAQVAFDDYGSIQSNLLAKALHQSAEDGKAWLNESNKAYPSLRGVNMVVSPYNALIMALNSDAKNYQTNVYTTFLNAKEEGVSVRSKQTSIPFNWYKWDQYVHRYSEGSSISKEEYAKLPNEEKSLYRPLKNKIEMRLFNIDQTMMNKVKADVYQEVVQESGKLQVSPDECFDKRWNEIKSANPDVIAIFRTPESYAVFGADAELLSEQYHLELTEKAPCEKQDTPLKMASIPLEKLHEYLPRFTHSGNRVAIYDGYENLFPGYSSSPLVKEKLEALTEHLLTMGANKTHIGVSRYEDGLLYVSEKKDLDNRISLDKLLRATMDYVMDDDRLAIHAPEQSTKQDDVAYKELIKELTMGAIALQYRMVATIDSHNKDLVPCWLRELKENPSLVDHIERDVNALEGMLHNILLGKIQEIDYHQMKGEKRAGLLAGSSYSILESISEQVSFERRLMVIVRDDKEKSADVILPEGSGQSMEKEIKGMAKNRILIALKKEGLDPEKIHFYNAGGVNGLKQPNEYFKDKQIEVCKLKQYELLKVSAIDATKELARHPNEIDRILVLMNKENVQHFYITVKGEPSHSFAVRPEGKDIKLFFESRRTTNAKEVVQELGNKYVELLKSHPDLEVDIFGIKSLDAETLSRLSKISAYKANDGKFYMKATIDGIRQPQKEISQTDYRCLFIADNAEGYKNALAARIYSEALDKSQEQSQEKKQDDNEEEVSKRQETFVGRKA